MRFSQFLSKRLALVVALVASMLLTAGTFSSVKAATFTVNTSADDNTTNGNCSLREAIRSANTHTAVDACPTGTGNDFIVFGVSSVSVTSPLPPVTGGNIVTIYGGSAKITLNANVSSGSIFTANSGSTLTVQNVNFTGTTNTCFQSAGTLNVIADSLAPCYNAVIATAGQAKVQTSTIHTIDTHAGNVGLNISDTTLTGGVPYTLYAGPGGATITHSTFGIAQVSITTNGPLSFTRSIINGNNNLAGISASATSVTVTNSIISGTTQTAIDPENNAQFTIVNSTILNNTYGLNGTSGSVSVKNTILSNTNNCYPGAGFTLVDNGGNLQNAAGCGSIPVGNPNLNASYVPQVGSPAIDGGINTGCPSNDYYGAARPVDGDANGTAICDIGAVEKQ